MDASVAGEESRGWSWEVGHAKCPRPESARSSTWCWRGPRPGSSASKSASRDLPIEPHIVAAAQEAAALGVGYTQSFGIAALREAIVERLRRVAGLSYAADEIVIGQGGVQAMSVTFAALLDAGDEVLLPDPAWPNYAMTALLRGAVAVPYALPAENDYLPDVDELRDMITERTRLIVINSPGEPHGRRVPGRAGGVDRRARGRARPVGALRRGVRRARLRGGDGQRRAVRPRASHRHLQLLQDVLDDRLAGRLRGVSALARRAARHAAGADAVVHLRGQPVRRPGGAGRAPGWRRPQARDLPVPA